MRSRFSAHIAWILLCCGLGGTSPGGAAERSGAAATEGMPRIAAQNVATLRAHLGEVVTATGRIDRTGKSRSGLQFLNFAGSELTVVCLPGDAANFPTAPVDLFQHKDVEVTGEVELFQGRLQIRIREPAQVRLLDPDARGQPAKIALQETAKDSWLSPAGLRYQGRDPAGLTRIAHIARHTRDMPDRDGPHGVFDGGIDAALAVIDEAWQLAQQRKLRPVVEGDRSTYTVHLNRRIGYLGGRTGAERGHPPLNRLLIVFETGTKNIITAYPK